MAEVTVITVTYNSINTIKACLDSIREQTFNDLETIVVDNDSKDGTKEFILSNYPEVKLVTNPENFGFSKANNQGIKLSKSRYILTLNPDAYLDRNFILTIIKFLNEESTDKRIGMISGKVLRPDSNIIDSTGIILTKFRRFYDRGSGTKDNGKYNKREKIFGPSGCSAFYKREMLEDIKEDTGYFDERFFCFVEDVDLAWRANNKGWSGVYLPEASCHHKRHGKEYDKKLVKYYSFWNRYSMIFKNDRFNIYSLFSLIFYDIPRSIFIIVTKPYIFLKYSFKSTYESK